MRSNGMIAVAVLAVLVSSLCLGGTTPDPNSLLVTIRCPAEDLHVGDAILIIFTITNRRSYPYEFDSRSADDSGRMTQYQLAVVDADGHPTPSLQRGRPGLGSTQGWAQVAPGASLEKTTTLNVWSPIRKPGTYTITGTFDGRHVSSPIRIVVKERSDAEMGRYIQGLVQELDALPPSDRRREKLVERLMYTGDKRIVPTLLDTMYKPEPNSGSRWAMLAFDCYLPRDAEVRDTVVATVKARGLTDGMDMILNEAGCGERDFAEIIRSSLASNDPVTVLPAVCAAQGHPSDEHMPRLIAIALDPNKIGSNRPWWMPSRLISAEAARAVAANRTDEGVAALKRLLDSPDEEICRDVSAAIRGAYTRHPILPEEVDEKYTAVLVGAISDPNYWMRWPQLPGEILRTRTTEGAQAILALAVDPNADLPQVHADAGVRAIRDFLKSSNPSVRADIQFWIMQVYNQPGRPLRADDFPSELRENPLARKQANLKRLSTRY